MVAEFHLQIADTNRRRTCFDGDSRILKLEYLIMAVVAMAFYSVETQSSPSIFEMRTLCCDACYIP